MLFYKTMLIPTKKQTEFGVYKDFESEQIYEKYHEDEVQKFLGFSEYNPLSSFAISDAKGDKREIAFACNRVNFSLEQILRWLNSYVEEYTGQQYKLQKLQEITGEKYRDFYGYHNCDELELDYFNECKESFIEDSHSDINLSVRDKLCLLGNEALETELTRIRSAKNVKTYMGNIVHYIIEATDRDNVRDMVNILLGALYANNRLLSKRITWFNCEGQRYLDDDELGQALQYSAGTALVLDGLSRNAQSELLTKVQEKLAKYARNTLIVFLTADNAEKIATIYKKNGLKPVIIKDGVFSKERAVAYLNARISKLSIAFEFDEHLEDYLPNREEFSFRDLSKSFNSYYDRLLAYKFYGAYAEEYELAKSQKNAQNITEAYQELDSMIGLAEVKKLLRQIVTMAMYNKCRQKAGLKVTNQSLHMCFKGNPGTAKTSMARIIGKILKVEGILANGTFVECGRAELVGKYVGWTAKQVEQKFAEAQGGILFIDEAYSLVEDRNSFATEAINTIVQEMENHKNDVIVIFAGYKEPMERFLDMNEGLRSRIPYQVDFPDYSTDELTNILLVMLQAQGYELESGTVEKVSDYFTQAKKQKDFGNGRFVRNFLEKTILKHAERVMQIENPAKDELLNLTEADLAMEKINFTVSGTKRIGFALG